MNVEMLEQAPQAYKLHTALFLYSGSAHDGLVATRHPVKMERGQSSLGPGEFVTQSFVASLLAVCDQVPLSYIPANTIAMSRNAVAWFEPAAVRTMFFHATSDHAVAAFDGQPVPQPPLLFVAKSRSLSVYTLGSNDRPTLSTPLYCAPFWNVYDTHTVCLGSMRIPKSFQPSDTSSWTSAFFASEFTHLSGFKRWAHSGTYAELLAATVAAGAFDPRWLKKTALTVERALCGN